MILISYLCAFLLIIRFVITSVWLQRSLSWIDIFNKCILFTGQVLPSDSIFCCEGHLSLWRNLVRYVLIALKLYDFFTCLYFISSSNYGEKFWTVKKSEFFCLCKTSKCKYGLKKDISGQSVKRMKWCGRYSWTRFLLHSFLTVFYLSN